MHWSKKIWLLKVGFNDSLVIKRDTSANTGNIMSVYTDISRGNSDETCGETGVFYIDGKNGDDDKGSGIPGHVRALRGTTIKAPVLDKPCPCCGSNSCDNPCCPACEQYSAKYTKDVSDSALTIFGKTHVYDGPNNSKPEMYFYDGSNSGVNIVLNGEGASISCEHDIITNSNVY